MKNNTIIISIIIVVIIIFVYLFFSRYTVDRFNTQQYYCGYDTVGCSCLPFPIDLKPISGVQLYSNPDCDGKCDTCQERKSVGNVCDPLPNQEEIFNSCMEDNCKGVPIYECPKASFVRPCCIEKCMAVYKNQECKSACIYDCIYSQHLFPSVGVN